MESSSRNISLSLAFLQEVIHRRLRAFLPAENAPAFTYPDLTLEQDGSALSRFLLRYKLNIEEYLLVLLSLFPHIQPSCIDAVVQQYLPAGGDLPEMGGVKGSQQRSTLPTAETAIFLLAGTGIEKRLEVLGYFSPEHFLAKENILLLEAVKEGEPRWSGRLLLQPEYVALFTTGSLPLPVFGPDFPARRVTTALRWEELVVNAKTMAQIRDLQIWLAHNNTLLQEWGLQRVIKPGYKALFYGPTGTGKTLTATLLGQQCQRDVYRIDLSQVVSKYIGETEKNLEKIFVRAENKNWILFFDEADALFGKRSGVQNAHDRYANQEVSYLLQRVEDFPGLMILASNFKSNLDPAFLRRFNSVVHFPMQDAAERKAIWEGSLSKTATLAGDVDIGVLASRYELSGSGIVSVIQYASLHTIHKGSTTICRQDILDGIRREYEKEEKVFH